jgi:hypothetical protein
VLATVVLGAVGFGCEQAPIMVDTEIAFQIPVNDLEAQEELSEIVIEAWPASLDVCSQFADWRQVVCNDTTTSTCTDTDTSTCPETEENPCPDIDLERRVPEPAKYQVRNYKTEAGWQFKPLNLGAEQNLQISIRGYTSEGQGILYGCSSLELGQKTVITLARPWCDQAVCLSSFRAGCEPRIDCGLQSTNSSSLSAGPVCVATKPFVLEWEENGEPCETIPSVKNSLCRPAVVLCQPGMFDVQMDGICPKAEATCKEDSEYPRDDLNCDGNAPARPAVSCDCTPGEIGECERQSSGCKGLAICGADFSYGKCDTEPLNVPEECDGIDSDCDELGDENDPDAHLDCQKMETGGVPRASRCRSVFRAPQAGTQVLEAQTSCYCGTTPLCNKPQSGCCNEECVNISSSEQHCGECGQSCGADQECCDSTCLDVTTDALNCGACGRTCDGSSNACCNSSCVDLLTSNLHCRGCGIQCLRNQECCGRSGCIDTQTDASNCGGCRLQCAPAHPVCQAGSCICESSRSCDPGEDCCGGGCTNLATDRNNCGSCGEQCRSTETCQSGHCRGGDIQADGGGNQGPRDAEMITQQARPDSGT